MYAVWKQGLDVGAVRRCSAPPSHCTHRNFFVESCPFVRLLENEYWTPFVAA
jgi:hypothetical protein